MTSTYTIKIAGVFKIIRAKDARAAVLKAIGKSPKSECWGVSTSNEGWMHTAACTAVVTKTTRYGTVDYAVASVYEHWAVTTEA